ncbi:Mitochondrial inner membrane translocase complex subunit Tim44 [Penicillium chermesinum]|uniref:Mitochondrial import inner membrane translocase subunit TIM44 n=1 Tax=Penicillium chermesinum TaxID=63820 RepID=A0A9W9PKD0_9EURO|nr:Mitochondrial inner membrane translocase complex subunit Tim44 [Penicillium chermesinum]KAJ5249058.1 Mitochondrial inner membrane translocase complex subunit Tim44 [Penicillium chermesinum]KAJ6151165.1 Mitochondrial inner membrane translocase complex subunit Tim44 [Penicillium chermesinum]
MISAKMATATRAAAARSHAPARVASQGSRAISYSTLPASSLRVTAQVQRSVFQAGHLPVSQLVSPFALPLTRSFHSANTLFQQQQEQKKSGEAKSESQEDGKKEEEQEGEKQKKDDAPPPPPHGDKSPWQVFRDTLQSEFKASKEWNESTKALASSAHQFTENENIKRARAAYEAASSATTSRTGAALKSTGQVIGKSAAWTWNTPVMKGVRKGVSATSSGLERATRPVRETEAYKSVKEAIDDGSSSRYGGWMDKEERRRQRQLREQQEAKSGKGKAERLVEDPEAGTNITLHKDSAWKESWRAFKDSNPMMQKLFSAREAYEESENPLVSTARSITDRITGFFAENETAQVIKKFREIDPNFQMEGFLRELREYMLPEVLDAYVKGDIETLKLWLSDAQFSVYAALAKQYTTAGLKSDGRILDVRGVDVSSARLLEPGEIPVFVVTCRAQEVHVYKNVKTGELAAGMEDKVQLVTYAIGMTRIPDEVNNPETRGWRLIELQKAARDYI